MSRIAGIDLPDSKRIDYSLTLIYGIGWRLSEKVLEGSRVDPSKRVRDLSEEELVRINKALESYVIEGDLRREIRQNIQRLRDISSYRGVRHGRSLPVRGQRTKTNARTKRGKRKTVGAFKKEALTKMTQSKK
ncbi:MAG: 30S ribosomal protein S13 [Candidatus Blackburnbacteria bacterium]|nr:30S ribosomal protein S13 [Candidatus Blackburnbacteria bacterium]